MVVRNGLKSNVQSSGAAPSVIRNISSPTTPDALKLFPATSPDRDMSNARTAALSRYLAALDSPPPAAGKDASVATAPPELSLTSPTAITTSVSNVESNEFETTFSSNNTSNGDMYNGHSVVAMPSLNGKSVREVVSSRNDSNTGNRPRSRSAARAPRSRDIVQDVYDRMGVSRDELARGDSDMFNERYRAAAAISANAHQQQQQRGRKLETSNTDGQRRARSLSRGRSVSGRWPPTRSQAAASAAAAVVAATAAASPARESAPQRPTVITTPDLRIDTNYPQQQQQQQQHQQHLMQSAVTPTDEGRINRAASFPERVTTAAWKKKVMSPPPPPPPPPKQQQQPQQHPQQHPQQQQQHPQQELPEPQATGEEPEEAAGAAAASAASAAKALSVKERINSLTGGKSNRKFAKRPVPVQYVKRDHPPLIDIYQEARKDESVVGAPPELSNVPPSPAAAAAADAAAELVRKNQQQQQQYVRSNAPVVRNSPARPTSTTSSNNINSSNQFMIAALTPNRPSSHNNMKPPTEIAGIDQSGCVADATSVALSSVSADDFDNRSPPSSHKRDIVSRRWTPVNGSAASKQGGRNHSMQSSLAQRSITSTTQSMNVEQMERIIEERVHTHVMELESRMENQMLRLENRMEDRMKQRMDVLETKMDKIGAMLSVIVSNRHEI